MSTSFTFSDKDETIPEDIEQLIIAPSVSAIPIEFCDMHDRLQQVTFSPSSIGRLILIQECAFQDCTSLKEVDLPSTVRVIEQSAFAGCWTLSRLSLKEGLKEIHRDCFIDCKSLLNFTFPSTITVLQDQAFSGCISLTSVQWPPNVATVARNVFEGCVDLRQADLPSTATTIQTSSFAACRSLMDVNLKEGLTDIYGRAFWSCTELSKISIPSTVNTLGVGAFRFCANLMEVHLVPGIKRIASCAFYQCSSLTAISIPATVTVVEKDSFAFCTRLISVEFPSEGSDTRVEDDAFHLCTSLRNISLKNQAQTASERCFGGCKLRIVQRLHTRFEGYPIHQKCYHASATTVAELRQEITNSSGQQLIDKFGMNPFHVLFSAVKPRPDLLQVLLDSHPLHLLGMADESSNMALDYLLCRRTEEWVHLARIGLTRWMVGSWGLPSWRSDMLSRIDEILDANDLQPRQEILRNSTDRMMEYQRLEEASLLELWLWKMALQSERQEETQGYKGRRRALCGAGFIIPMVVSFLGNDLAILILPNAVIRTT